MRGKDLLECIEYIDDVLVEEALNPPDIKQKNRKLVIVRWSMAAACIMVIGISATALWSHHNINKDHIKNLSAPITSEPATDIPVNANTTNGSSQLAGAVADESIHLADQASVTDGLEAANAEAEDLIDNPMQKNDNTSGISDLNTESYTGMTEQKTVSDYYTVISKYSAADDSLASKTSGDAVPLKGEFLCTDSLQEAMEHYKTQEESSNSQGGEHYAYAVVIKVFGDIQTEPDATYDALELTDAGYELIEQEYRRLLEAGYNVRLSEDFRFTGTFTNEEIEGFEGLPEYGYLFGFDDEN